MSQPPGKLLTVIVCGAGPADRIGDLVDLAHADGWTVQLVATAAAVPMLNLGELEAMTGAPIRTDYRQPQLGSRRRSAADGLIIAPATYNTINKLALGINDTYPLNVAAEAIGRRTPVIIAPFVNTALAARRPFITAVQQLRSEGVRILLGEGEWTPHPPGSGTEPSARFPWPKVLEALNTSTA